jgi:hypothetical protein
VGRAGVLRFSPGLCYKKQVHLANNPVDLREGAATPNRVWLEWREALAILFVGAALCVLADALVFRSRFYTRVLDPHASTGDFEATLSMEAAREYWARGVLILGDSRMVQGFSARLANWLQLARGYQFSNVAIPATRERCWYYLLRDLDPDRTRYSVIVVPLESYDDRDLHADDPADKTLDAYFLAVRLRLLDSPEFAASFRGTDQRMEAIRLGLIKGLVYRQDVHAFLEHPRQRIAEVRNFRRFGDENVYRFDGFDGSLSGVGFDRDTGLISFPNGFSTDQKQDIQDGILEPVPPQRGYLGDFRRRWLGRIVARYQGTATRILFLRPPINAFRRLHEPPDTGRSAVRALASRPGVLLIDEHAFDELERPEFFVDFRHLNATGRARFTTKFATLFAQTIHGQQPAPPIAEGR